MKTVANRVGDEIILEQLQRREDAMLDASNAVDSKASQLFAAAAFLAVQPAVLLTQQFDQKWILIVQWIGCALLFIVFLLAHNILKVRGYDTVNPTDEWRDETIAQAGKDKEEEDGPGLMVWSLIDGARERIATKDKIHSSRLTTLRFGRWVLTLALVANAISLGGLTLRHPSSQASTAPASEHDNPCGAAGAVPGHE